MTENSDIFYVNEEVGPLRSNVKPNLIVTSLTVIYSFTPLLSRILIPEIKLFIILLWLLTAVSLKRPSNVKPPRNITKWWALYVILIYVSCIIGHSSYSLNFFISRLPVYCIPFIMLTVLCKYNLCEKKILWKIMAIAFILNLSENIITGFATPGYFTGLDGIDDTAVRIISNAGGTGFIAVCLFSIPIWWMINRITNNGRQKKISLIVLFMCIIYITVLNSRTTALLILGMEIIGFGLAANNKKRTKNKSSRGLIIKVLLIVAVGVYFLIPLLNYLVDLYEFSPEVADRLTDLKTVAEGEDVETLRDGSLLQRYLLWMTSINTFLASVPNFLFGIGDDFSSQDLAGLLKSGIGRHSEFFDLAAKYGMLGIIIVFNAWHNTFLLFRTICGSEKMKYIINVFVVAFVMYSFVNYSPSLLLVQVFVPLSIVLLNHNII